VTPFLWGLVAGGGACHVFWAAVFVGWWFLLIKRSGEDVQQAVRDDFAAVRASLKRAANARRN
jgi:hypothetical protein